MGRLFCPRCGNSALDKVQLVVGPDGSEQYGVKRKHILRGTRFSLPKPKVGGDEGVGEVLGVGLAQQRAPALGAAPQSARRCWLATALRSPLFPPCLLPPNRGGATATSSCVRTSCWQRPTACARRKKRLSWTPLRPSMGRRRGTR